MIARRNPVNLLPLQVITKIAKRKEKEEEKKDKIDFIIILYHKN